MSRLLCLLFALCLAAPLCAATEGQAPSLLPGPPIPEATGPVASLELALMAYRQAAKQQQPLAMAEALRHAQSIRLRQAGAWAVETTALTPTEQATAGPGAESFDLAQLLSPQTAAGLALMAEEDEDLADLLALPNPVQASAVQKIAQIAPHSQSRWQIAFNGQTPAEIGLFAANNGLEWQVTDRAASVICARAVAWAQPVCHFTPQSNGYVMVEIRNSASTEQHYILLSN